MASVAPSSLRETPHDVEHPPDIEDLTAEGVLVRLLVKTVPSKQWDVARELRARIGESLRREGIELALPRREVVVERPSAAATARPPGPAPAPAPAADRQG